MSVNGIFTGGLERTFAKRLTTTANTVIVTGDKNNKVASFSLANETASAVIVECYYYDGATDFLVFRRSVPGDDTIVVSDIPLRLYDGDIFKVKAATANAITVTVAIIRSHPNEQAQQ